jgi:hypothetical protein
MASSFAGRHERQVKFGTAILLPSLDIFWREMNALVAATRVKGIHRMSHENTDAKNDKCARNNRIHNPLPKYGSSVEAWPPHSQRLSRPRRILNLK